MMATPWQVDTKINNRCRLCGEVKNDLRYIFNDNKLVENIRHHISIYILDNDDLSKYVCQSCVHSLESMIKFISTCRNAQQKLHLCRQGHFAGVAPVYACYLQTGNIKEEYSEEITMDDYVNTADVRFTRNNATSEVSLAADGESNIFLTIKYQPKGWSKLSRLDDQCKKRLGTILYDRHKNEIEQEQHITMTLSEIEDELTELEDPLLLETSQSSLIADTKREDIPNGTVADFGRLKLNCDLCSFTTTKNWYLNQHYNDTHAKPFTCEQCGKGFGDMNRLQKHVKIEHTDRAPLTCKICGEEFMQRYHYTQHLQTHRGNNATSWTCDNCGEHFSQVNKLNYHKAVRHNSDELPCPHCSFHGKSKYHLKQHDREVHQKTFECNECGKKVGKKSKLIEHIQCKHFKIPYECDACHSKYSSKKWFEGHVEKCPQRAFMREVSPPLPMV